MELNLAEVPYRVGVASILKGINDTALRFLVLHLNVLQPSFEFEFVPFDGNDSLVRQLNGRRAVARSDAEGGLLEFYDRQLRYWKGLAQSFDTPEALPPNLIIVSTARLDDGYYMTRRGNVSLIALGDWRRSMAPPSVVEFILTLVIADAASRVVIDPPASLHLGTKGCLGDFTPVLVDARQQVLSSFLCHSCRIKITAAGGETVLPSIHAMIDKKWLGTASDQSSPAGIVASLGYDLFITKGLRPTLLESARTAIQQDGWKQLITLVAGVALAVVLVVLGIK